MAQDFYQTHLDRVSRSFAFCIAQLEGDFRDWTSLSYLLCRLLDTVEDAPWENTESQSQAYAHFLQFLEQMPDEGSLRLWIASFPAHLPEGERHLIAEAGGCFGRFHALSPGIRAKMRGPILNMYRGMRFFSERKRGEGIRLGSLREVNQYCFFVAGVVGELLTSLWSGASGLAVSAGQTLDAHHFGLFLQKVNLLKDQREDERQGRHLVAPSREELLASMRANAEGAIRYILSLPKKDQGYRIFCAWSLFLGLSSLRWMERTTLFGRVFMNKPPRLFTKRTLLQVRRRIDDEGELLALFRRSLPNFPPKKAGPETFELRAGESLTAYQGPLEPSQLRALGLI